MATGTEWIRRGTGTILLAAICAGGVSCKLFGGDDGDDDKTLLLLGAAYIVSNPCLGGPSTGSTIANSAATLGGDGCVNGVATTMDGELPAWIKNNFKCSVGYVSTVNSSYYCFKSKNLPNATSPYWGTGSALFTASVPGGNSANPNKTASQNFVYAIPVSPTANTGTLSGTQAGLASIGITVNGLAVYNNAAAAPDTLSTEAKSFDNQGGHPQNTGIYHHHANVTNGTVDLTSTAALVGIALDGYAIYGANCSGQGGGAATGLDTNHGHTTTTSHFTAATYHYHYANDATAGISTLMGSNFYGRIGSVSN